MSRNETGVERLETSKVTIHEIRDLRNMPQWISVDSLADFLHMSLKPYDDPVDQVKSAIEYALSVDGSRGGFVLLAEADLNPVGALVMLRTGMGGYIPENILVYVAVDPSSRGSGLGSRIITKAFELAEGDVKLHVEYDNPAKRLYERLGMTSKYAEMRYIK